jgi:hypothetical protein
VLNEPKEAELSKQASITRGSMSLEQPRRVPSNPKPRAVTMAGPPSPLSATPSASSDRILVVKAEKPVKEAGSELKELKEAIDTKESQLKDSKDCNLLTVPQPTKEESKLIPVAQTAPKLNPPSPLRGEGSAAKVAVLMGEEWYITLIQANETQ